MCHTIMNDAYDYYSYEVEESNVQVTKCMWGSVSAAVMIHNPSHVILNRELDWCHWPALLTALALV